MLLTAVLALWQGVNADIAGLVKQMTLEEKVSLCHAGSEIGTKAIARLGIPEYRFSDGPNGVRDQELAPTTYFPTGVAMAASWDPALIHQVGAALGEEARSLGKSVLLGPAVNIDLTPLGGRGFEYESEDPFLNSRMCVGYIEGVQSQGVVSCIKHFAVNSVEQERVTMDAQVDERTLREIYLPAFEAAVKEAHVGAVMAAYNKLNGAHCAENKHLLKDILRDEWGFEGFVMSDWGAVHSTVPTALNGLDLEMRGPGDDFLGRLLLDAVRAGAVPESAIDAMVTRTLTALSGKEFPNFAGKPAVSTPDHQALARKLAEQSMVLLKNDRAVLPFDKKSVRSLAVIGPNANAEFGAGGGSGSVVTPYEITALNGIQRYLGPAVDVRFALGADPDVDLPPVPQSALFSPDGVPGLKGEYFENQGLRGSPAFSRIDPVVSFDWDAESPQVGFPSTHFSARWTGFLAPSETGNYEFGLASDDGSRLWLEGKLAIDNWGLHGVVLKRGYARLEKGRRYPVRIDFFQGDGGADVRFGWRLLPAGPKRWIEDAVSLAKSCDKVVIVGGCNHDIEGEGTDKPNIDLPDDQDELISAVLAVRPDAIVVLVNGTPIAMPWIGQSRGVIEAWYPGMEGGSALARVLFGDVSPSGKLPVTFPMALNDSPAHALGDYPPRDGVLHYDEGVLVGYRWFDKRNIEPLFPFGYGLSYTKFKFGPPKAVIQGQSVDVIFTVRNVGHRAGAEVAQLYVAPQTALAEEPDKELKAFAKIFLKPGAQRRVTLHLDKRSFAHYSVLRKDWIVEDGSFGLLIGASSRDIREKMIVSIPEDV